jgi:site-specific DNA recombinase
MKQAVIYCRVSTKEQTQNLSLPTQRRACEDYCRREGFDVAEAFMEQGESAKTAERTQFQALLAYCRQNKGRIQVVVVYNLTRFSRSTTDHALIKVLLAKLGISLRSVTEPIDESSSGKLMENVLAAFGQFDNDVKAERTCAGMRAAIERGRWTFQAPIGYVNGGRSRPCLLHDPERADAVRRAFRDYASGRYTKQEVLRRVTALGLRTRRGKKLSAQSLGTMLRNRLYAGWINVPKWRLSVRGEFEPLVSEAVFGRVQARLEGKAKSLSPYHHNHPDFPLRRFVRCARCSTPLTGSWSKGRGGRYGYYHCRCRACGKVRVSKSALEEAFVETLDRIRPKPAFVQLLNAVVRDAWKEQEAQSRESRRRAEEELQESRRRLDVLEEAFIYRSRIDQATYERQRDKLREEITLAEMALSDARLAELDVEGVLGFAEHVLTNAGRLWTDAPLDQKQRLQQALFPKGLEFDGEGFGTAATCLAFTQLRLSEARDSRMASPTGFEPGSPASPVSVGDSPSSRGRRLPQRLAASPPDASTASASPTA